VHFLVRDIESAGGSIAVTFLGNMPDTLKPGRDVILQGNFDGEEFHANELLTQCPSKYEPPVPGGSKANQGSY
jgi:cytochrome c-type biogenesis protein CcmE